MYKCSIITICRNAEKEISKTIESVLNQDYNFKEIEMIIVDGLSSDNTKNVVDSYMSEANKKGLIINFNSEKDKGIYDAMNKGIDYAKGEWCLFLNAGDYFFYDKSLSNLLDGDISNYNIVYGDTVHNYDNKFTIVKSKYESELNYKNGMEFCHQSCIIRTDYLKNHKYSLDYKIAGDCDFFTNAYINKIRFHYIPKVVSVFSRDGLSSKNGAMVYKENNYIKYKYGLVTEKEYLKANKKYNVKIKIRSFFPKRIINMRQKKNYG